MIGVYGYNYLNKELYLMISLTYHYLKENQILMYDYWILIYPLDVT